jgi:hypothetical protein
MHQALVRTETILTERLEVRIYAHEIEGRDGLVSCCTYVTRGFALLGQRELAFSVRRLLTETRADFSTDPLKLFGALWHRVQSTSGALIQSGDVFALEPDSSFLGRNDVRGVGVLPWISSDGLTVEAIQTGAPLLLIALVAEELDVARDYGLLRVSARLGQNEGLFHTCPYFDRTRKSVVPRDNAEKTVLGRCMRVTVRAGSACVEQDRVTLRLPVSAAEALREPLGDLPAETGLVLLLPLDETADGLLCWEPGSKELTAIGDRDSRGLRVGANFVVFVSDQPDDGANPLEDGFALRMTKHTWTLVRRALATGEAIEIAPTDSSLPWRIEWNA